MTSILAACGLVAGSAVGALAQEAGVPTTPGEFSGHVVCGPDVRAATDERESIAVGGEDWRHSRTRGGAWRPIATVSDPRLEGTWSVSYDWDEYRPLTSASATMRVGSETWRIENGEGAWQGSLNNVFLPGSDAAMSSAVLTGEGGYEGMSVLWQEQADWNACTWDVKGLIVEGAPPPAPEPPAAE